MVTSTLRVIEPHNIVTIIRFAQHSPTKRIRSLYPVALCNVFLLQLQSGKNPKLADDLTE